MLLLHGFALFWQVERKTGASVQLAKKNQDPDSCRLHMPAILSVHQAYCSQCVHTCQADYRELTVTGSLISAGSLKRVVYFTEAEMHARDWKCQILATAMTNNNYYYHYYDDNHHHINNINNNSSNSISSNTNTNSNNTNSTSSSSSSNSNNNSNPDGAPQREPLSQMMTDSATLFLSWREMKTCTILHASRRNRCMQRTCC